MNRWKHLPLFLSALLCTASCNLGTSPGGGTEGEGLSGLLQDPSGRPVAGVLVRVFPEANRLGKSGAVAEAVFDSVYSDGKGYFRFDSLPRGDYGLRTYSRRGDTTLVLLLRSIGYSGGQKSLGTQTLIVGGKLVMQVRAAGETSENGQPLQGTQCGVVGLPYLSVADETGRCVIDALPPGQYAVRLSHAGFADIVTVPIEVRPGQASGEGPWDLAPAGSSTHYPGKSSTLAHWTFDARDSLTGLIPDRGARQIGLQTYGSVPLNPSPFGKAASFDGVSYLATAKAESSLVGRSGRYLTLEARVRLKSYPSPLNRDSSGAVLGALGGYTLLVRTDGSLAVMTSLDTNADWTIAGAWSARGVVPLNRWVSLAVSIDLNAMQAYGFIDGRAVQLRNWNAFISNGPRPAGPFHVGFVPGMKRVFTGEIDEARVSDSLVLGVGLPLARMDSSAFKPNYAILAGADAAIASAVPGNAETTELGNLNYGTTYSYAVGTDDMTRTTRVLVRFALPAGLQPASISRAVLRMRRHSWVGGRVQGSARVDVHRVLRSWNEGSAAAPNARPNTAGVNGVTARQRYWSNDSSSNWGQALLGLDGADASAGSWASATFDSQADTWEWDVTELARTWAADTTLNLGLLLVSAFPAANSAVRDYPVFHSREAGSALLRPTLFLNGEPAIKQQETLAKVTLQASADAVITAAAPAAGTVSPNTGNNYGTLPVIVAGTDNLNASSRTLLRFAIPPTQTAANIQSAVIRIAQSRWIAKNTRRAFRIDVHPMLKSWKEGRGGGTPNSAAVDGATARERFWGTQNGTEDWSHPLVGLNDTDAARLSIASVSKTSGTGGYWEFNVTELAKAWAADSTKNFGVLLASPFPQTASELWDYPELHSRESAGDSLRPVLILNGTPVSSPPADTSAEFSVSSDADVAIAGPVPGQADVNGFLSKNYGKDTVYSVSCYDMQTCSRLLVRFPIPGGYAGASIRNATLQLVPVNWVARNQSGDYMITANKVLKSWKEGLGGAGGLANSLMVNGATGRARFWGPDSSADWTSQMAGANGRDAAMSPASPVSRQVNVMATFDFDVTTFAKAWADDSTTNFGVYLTNDFPTNSGAMKSYPVFASREHANAAYRPRLIINKY